MIVNLKGISFCNFYANTLAVLQNLQNTMSVDKKYRHTLDTSLRM